MNPQYMERTTLIARDGRAIHLEEGPKAAVAARIVAEIGRLLDGRAARA